MTEATVENICAAMAALREREARMNKQGPLYDCECYGPPNLSVTYEGWVTKGDGSEGPHHECVLIEYAWDHTMESIREAAEMARRGQGSEGLGKVYIEVDLICPDYSAKGEDREYGPFAVFRDSGFCMEVWPNFTGECKWETENKQRKAAGGEA